MNRSSSSRVRQLALPFVHAPAYRAQDFLPAPSNATALAWLARPAAWPQGRLALWGPEGCGKTHLLHLWAERMEAEGMGGTVLPGPMLSAAAALAPTGPLAVDDADAAPERPLLHLLNAAAESGLPVLLAAREAPARWDSALPDLASRLRATTAVEIDRAEEELLAALLHRLLAERQLVVAEPLLAWLLRRLPRSQAAMREAAARLDHAALAAGRAVGRAQVQEVAAALSDGEEAMTESPEPSPPGARLL